MDIHRLYPVASVSFIVHLPISLSLYFSVNIDVCLEMLADPYFGPRKNPNSHDMDRNYKITTAHQDVANSFYICMFVTEYSRNFIPVFKGKYKSSN